MKRSLTEEFAELSGRYLCDGHIVEVADDLAAGYLAIKYGMKKQEFINYGKTVFRNQSLHEVITGSEGVEAGGQGFEEG